LWKWPPSAIAARHSAAFAQLSGSNSRHAVLLKQSADGVAIRGEGHGQACASDGTGHRQSAIVIAPAMQRLPQRAEKATLPAGRREKEVLVRVCAGGKRKVASMAANIPSRVVEIKLDIMELKLDRLIDEMRFLKSHTIVFDTRMRGIQAYLKPSEPSEQQPESKSTPWFAAVAARRQGQLCLESGQRSERP
jgi:hypothetical protein